MTVKERITALREVMAEKKIDAYLVPTDDFHASEYVGEYFKCRKYISFPSASTGLIKAWKKFNSPAILILCVSKLQINTNGRW